MALKRTRVLGWTKKMTAAQAEVNKMSRAGNLELANMLNEMNRENHSARVKTIMRLHKHRGG